MARNNRHHGWNLFPEFESIRLQDIVSHFEKRRKAISEWGEVTCVRQCLLEGEWCHLLHEGLGKVRHSLGMYDNLEYVYEVRVDKHVNGGQLLLRIENAVLVRRPKDIVGAFESCIGPIYGQGAPLHFELRNQLRDIWRAVSVQETLQY